MSTEKSPSKAAQLLSAIKALFVASIEDAIVVTTNDGIELSVSKMEVGGTVQTGGAPAPANTYVLQDGSSLVVDAAGLITAITPASTETPAEAAPVETSVQASSQTTLETPEQIRKSAEAFATGTPEERLTNLEICVKALMESTFGWQMKEAAEKADREAAMTVYKTSLATTQATVANQQQAMEKIVALVSELVQLPADEPPADTKNKFSFSKLGEKKKGLEKFQEAARQLTKQN